MQKHTKNCIMYISTKYKDFDLKYKLGSINLDFSGQHNDTSSTFTQLRKNI